MDVNKILGADLLDIVFEGRNKEYGAYELRSQYKKRLTTAMLITASLMLLLVLGSFILKTVSNQRGKVEVKEVQLEEIKQEEKNEPPPPPRRLSHQIRQRWKWPNSPRPRLFLTKR